MEYIIHLKDSIKILLMVAKLTFVIFIAYSCSFVAIALAITILIYFFEKGDGSKWQQK